MKPVKHLIKWSIMLLLLACASKGMAQGPYPKTGNDTVCHCDRRHRCPNKSCK